MRYCRYGCRPLCSFGSIELIKIDRSATRSFNLPLCMSFAICHTSEVRKLKPSPGVFGVVIGSLCFLLNVACCYLHLCCASCGFVGEVTAFSDTNVLFSLVCERVTATLLGVSLCLAASPTNKVTAFLPLRALMPIRFCCRRSAPHRCRANGEGHCLSQSLLCPPCITGRRRCPLSL